MPKKFNTPEDLRNHVSETQDWRDFHELGELISGATVYAYTGANTSPGGDENSEFMMAFPNGLKKFNKENLSDPDFDDTSEYYLTHLDSARDRLRDSGLYDHILKGVKAYDKDNPGALQKFYSEMHRLDQVFGLELHIEDLDPEYEKAINTINANAVKQKQEEKKAAEAKAREEAQKKTWENYDRLHMPKEGEVLSDSQKKDCLSKRITASYINTLNQQEGVQETPFSKNLARNEAAKLRNTWAFKHLAETPGELDETLSQNRADLAELAESIRRPFKQLTFEERIEKIVFLKRMCEQHMMGPEGRSSKYRNMYNSIMNACNNKDNLQDCDDPALNGEDALQGIFNNTEKYMKGKKSLRKKGDEQCRFDQAADIIGCLGNGSRGAELMAKGLIDRVNEVRRGKGQKLMSFTDLGRNDCFAAHSNARRLQLAQEKRQRELEKKQGALPRKSEKQAAPKKQANPGVAAKFSEIEEYKKKYEADSKIYSTVQHFPGEENDFSDYPANFSKTGNWDIYKDEDTFFNRTPLKQMIASTLAMKDTEMYYSPKTKRLGVSSKEYAANYDKYMKDPAVEKLAEKLKPSAERNKLFKSTHGIRSIGDLDFGKLQDAYNGAKKELAGDAPTL